MRKLLTVVFVMGTLLVSGCYSCKSHHSSSKDTSLMPKSLQGKFFWCKECRAWAAAQQTREPVRAVLPVRAAKPEPQPEQSPQPVVLKQTAPNVVARTYPCGNCGILRMDKRMPEEVAINAPFAYTIKVTNETGAMVDNVVVKERIAENFKVIETSPAAESDARMLQWALGSIEPESSKTITVRGVATSANPVMQCATMTYVVPACATTNVVEPQLVLAKSLPSDALLCDIIPMKVQVRNSGTGVAKNVVIQMNCQPT